MTEELKQAAQQALEALGYGVAWKEGGHQKARAAIDALGAALTTSKPAQAGGVDAKCQTCNGHGLVGGHMQDGSGYGEGCPDCNPEPAPLVKWASTQPAAQATPEPTVTYATVRAAYDELHIECRFSDGQKFAAVTVAQGFDNLAHRIETMLNESQQATPEPSTDVRTILLSIVPGDGNGQEVYAKSVDDVVAKLTELSEREESLSTQVELLTAAVEARGREIAKLKAAPEPVGEVPGGQPADEKTRWIIRRNGDGEFGQATGWLYRDGGHPCSVTGKPVYVWRPLSDLIGQKSSAAPIPVDVLVGMYDESPTSDGDMIAFARAVERHHGIAAAQAKGGV